MRRALFLALALAGCNRAPLALPDDPLARATTCTAVRALELGSGRTKVGNISFEGFTEILHFAMLHSAQDAVEVDLARLIAVSRGAPVARAEIDGANWASLVEPCNAAFPETQQAAALLLPDPYEAGMTCFALADFIASRSATMRSKRLSHAVLKASTPNASP